jgi:hypothetical protein
VSKAWSVFGAVVLTVLLSSCGSSGPSLSTYKQDFQNQKTKFTQLGRDLATTIQSANGKSNSQLASEFAGLATRGNQTASNLRNLKPPSKYKSQNSQLAADFNTVAADLSSISTAASSNNGPSARAGTQKLLQDAANLRAVDRSLTASLGLPQRS